MAIVTSADRPDLHGRAAVAFKERWPGFIFHDEISRTHMSRVKQYFGRFDIMVLDNDAVAAGGWGVPIPWSGDADDLPSGYDDALVREAGLVHVIAPLRPTWKHRYPTVSMEEYAAWARADGLSIDP